MMADNVKEVVNGKGSVVQHVHVLLVSPGEANFRESRVPFKKINLERDPQAARDIVRKTGQAGVPVIKIGNRWIAGFDKERIEKELGLG
jgi:glutaredoxin